MTLSDDPSSLIRCAWCSREFPAPGGPGRPPRYCRRSHRQRAYEARRLGDLHRLTGDDVLITRSLFESLRDTAYRVEAALDDIDADLRDGADPASYRQALWHLYESAADLRSIQLEPRAIGARS